MKRRKMLLIFAAALLLSMMLFTGCGKDNVRKDAYQYVVGVSLINVTEPWLNQLSQALAESAKENDRIRLVFRDAAGNAQKQVQDMESLMDYGIDLLVAVPEDTEEVCLMLDKIYEEIPVIMVGVGASTSSFTSFIHTDDEMIGRIAGEYILENCYKPGNDLVLLKGAESSPLSRQRMQGFEEAVSEVIPEENITEYSCDWLRDVAELRMKDYLVSIGIPDIVWGFNDEMAYGAFIACQQLRVNSPVHFIGVDGFSGKMAGLDLVKRGILDATVQCPGFGSLTFETIQAILSGEEPERDITIIPELIQ